MLDSIPPETFEKPKSAYVEMVLSESNDAYPSLSCIADRHLETMTEQELDQDWKLNEFFGTIVIINLPQCRDRLFQITKELQEIGHHVYRVFRAVDGRKDVDKKIWNKIRSNRETLNLKTEEGRSALDRIHQGEAGCYLSHYQVIKSIKESYDRAMELLISAKQINNVKAIQKANLHLRKFRNVLILEDDSGFGRLQCGEISRQGVGIHLRKALKNLPNDWHMLYFQIFSNEPTIEVAPFIRKISSSWSTSAYAVNYTMYDTLVTLLGKIEDPSVKKVKPIDNEYGLIHEMYNVYAICPSVIYSHESLSYISEKITELRQGHPD